MVLAVNGDVNNVSSTPPDILLAAQKRNAENNAGHGMVIGQVMSMVTITVK